MRVERNGGGVEAHLVLRSRRGRLVFFCRLRRGRRGLFGLTRCEGNGCDVSAIEAGKQVFTPSDGGLKAAIVSHNERSRTERERLNHTKEDIREHTEQGGEYCAKVESALCFAHREPTLTALDSTRRLATQLRRPSHT